MTFTSSPPSASGPRKSGRPSPLLLTIVSVVILLGLFVVFAQIYTDVMWFRHLDVLAVFTTEWLTRGVLFLVGLVLMALPVWFCLWWAHRARPVYAPTTARQENLDRYREAFEPLRRVLTLAIPAVVGLLGAVAFSAGWQDALLMLNASEFGRTDPQFGLDIGFYVFTLPMLQGAGAYLGMVALLTFLASLVAHYLYGGIRPGEHKGIEFTRAAQVQLAITAAVLVLVQAGRIFLARFGALTDSTGIVTGVTYTGDKVTQPALLIIAVAAVVVAGIVAANAFARTWKLSIISVVMLAVLGAISVIGMPMVVQQFQVQPSEQSLEADYIQRNIEATKDAYGIDEVETISYSPETQGQTGALREDAETAASIRLLDPNLVSDTFRQLQQQRAFYSFPEQLDVDRYEIDGEIQDTVIALRELNPASQADASWVNQATVYTHGFGVVAAYGNRQGEDGQPDFLEENIPPNGELTGLDENGYEPRIYFGENSPRYSIVGAPEGTAPREIDYPADGADGTGQVLTTYTGDGGPGVGSYFHRLLYTLKFQDEQILLSDAVNEESQILYERHPRERIEKVAPFLEVDGDPYPAVIDGRIQWIVDAYTTSAEYPYSTPSVLQDATTDSNTETTGAVQALPPEEVNYIRNSVKVTVDAFDGSVELYAWDEEDPILQTWQKVFPDLFTPVDEMSADLMSHVRYPEDLFKVQRELLTRYHVDDANGFYTGQDFWTNPSDPTISGEQTFPQPPYYLTLRMPGQEQSAFSLTSSFIPRPTSGQTRNNLTGFVAANADAGSEAGTIDEDYGTIRLLQLPRNTTFPGPGQAQNNFNTEPEIQQSLNLLRQGESEVENGNLLTLPVAGGLLYVQPVYVRSAGETSYPVLQRVLVAFGEQIGFAPTLDEALDQVFGGDSGVSAGDADSVGQVDEEGATGSTEVGSGEGTEEGSTDTGSTDTGSTGGSGDPLRDAQQAMEDSQEALEEGDWAAYGEAQERLQTAIEEALAEEGVTTAPTQPAEDTATEAPEE
ncbi:UPF0182 family membrane protein [Brevibacterium litoralis]|uniref:UPF0182 family membrane protein n=1 Tax=Brevibacterium litoralis TaxID=3138935 RepID=UPI0032EE9C96